MKYATLVTTLGLLGFSGCVTAPGVTIAPAAIRPANETSVAVVKAEQVTPQNAQKMSQALADELDREAQREIIGTAIPKH